MQNKYYVALIAALILAFSFVSSNAALDDPVKFFNPSFNLGGPDRSQNVFSTANTKFPVKTIQAAKVAAHNGVENLIPESTSPNQFSLNVSIDPQIPVQLKSYHQRLSSLITQAKIPVSQTRINFFRSRYNDNSPDVIGWNAIITSAQPVSGGVVATLRVTAKHKRFIDNLYCIETYLIADDGIHFVDISFPASQPRDILSY